MSFDNLTPPLAADINQRHGERRSTVDNLLRTKYRYRVGLVLTDVNGSEPYPERSVSFTAPDNLRLTMIGVTVDQTTGAGSDVAVQIIQDDEKNEFLVYESPLASFVQTSGRESARTDYSDDNVVLFKGVRYRLELFSANGLYNSEFIQIYATFSAALRRQ